MTDTLVTDRDKCMFIVAYGVCLELFGVRYGWAKAVIDSDEYKRLVHYPINLN